MSLSAKLLWDRPLPVRHKQVRLVRSVSWAVALGLGVANAWITRCNMNQDGISYLDIGDAYWRGDWHNAVNAYWSPLYSWILGFIGWLYKPTPYGEYPLVHFVNLLIYLAALWCFEYLLNNIIEQRAAVLPSNSEHLPILPDLHLRLIGYAIFVSCAVILIGLGPISPDMCVLALVCLGAALLVRIRTGHAGYPTYAALGIVVGVAYLAKSAMFLLAFVFLGTAFVAGGISLRSLRATACATACFLCVSGPFILVLSHAKGRFTFGDSGKINYAVCVTGDDWYIPVTQKFIHPVHIQSASPLIYEFARPISGTYPLWYDLSYWHDGVKVRFNWHAQGIAILEGLRRYQLIWFNTFRQLNLALGVLILFALCPSARFLRTMFSLWTLWIVGTCALAMYALVVVEFRYVAPFVLLIWLATFSGLEHPPGHNVGRVIPALVAGICATTLVLALLWTWLSRTPDAAQYPAAATALRQLGLEAGDRLAVIGVDPAGRDGAYVARLGRMKIVAELRDPDAYWNAPSPVRERITETVRETGAQAIIANHALSLQGWVRLGNTEYSLYRLRKPN